MKFLVLCSPTTRFLLNKYLTNLSPAMQGSTAIKKFNAHEILTPDETKNFIQALSELHAYLEEKKLVSRIVVIRKLVGTGPKWKGLLNLLIEMGQEVYVYSYEPGSIQNLLDPFQKIFYTDLPNVRVIAPLSLDEMEEIYSFFHVLVKVPVYPFIQNFMTSKGLSNLTFAPCVPRGFYFPQGTDACDFVEKIQKIVHDEKISHLILKDEYDFDLRAIIPYTVTPVDSLSAFLDRFYSKAEGITNIGGLVLEEFLVTGNKIQVNKSHIFNRLIPGGDIQIVQTVKPFAQGGFLSSIIDQTSEEKIEVPSAFIGKLDPVVKLFYQNLFSSIDYIIYDNVPRVIDVNSVANAFNAIQYPPNFDVDAIFKFFVTQIITMKNAEGLLIQVEFQSAITRLYQAVRKVGPTFVSGERVITLIDMCELNLKKFLEENFK